MWLGLLYLPSDDDDGDEVLLCAWRRGRERPLTAAGPLHAAPEMARALRNACISAGSPTMLPRCDGCLTAFDLPLL
jgi:hypothetical protein